MTRSNILARSIAILSLIAAMPAVAQTVPGFAFTGGNYFAGSRDYTMGYSFTANTAMTVSALGYYDQGADGLLASHQIGLWDSTGALLAQTTVPSGSAGTLIAGFRYTNLASTYTMTAGQTYTLGGTTNGNADGYYFGATSVTSTPGVTYGASAFNSSATFARPVSAGATNSFFGPNMLFDTAAAAPEPATWGLMMLGFGMTGAALRRRRRKASGSFFLAA